MMYSTALLILDIHIYIYISNGFKVFMISFPYDNLITDSVASNRQNYVFGLSKDRVITM